MAEEIKEEVTKDLSQSEQPASEESKANKKIESLESALRRFKRQSSGIISEVRKREAYDKPGIRRREAKKAGIKNSRKREKNNRD